MEEVVPGPSTYLLMPSKEASLQTLPLSVLTPRWGEGDTDASHGAAGTHSLPWRACLPSQAQNQAQTGEGPGAPTPAW